MDHFTRIVLSGLGGGLVLLFILAPWRWTAASSARPGLGRDLLRTFFPASARGLWLATLPSLAGVLLLHGLVWHQWWVLGRWPNYGEEFTGVLGGHVQAVWVGMGTLWCSMVAMPVALIVCLLWRRARSGVGMCLVHGVSVGLAFATLALAPAAFLNWLAD